MENIGWLDDFFTNNVNHEWYSVSDEILPLSSFSREEWAFNNQQHIYKYKCLNNVQSEIAVSKCVSQ